MSSKPKGAGGRRRPPSGQAAAVPAQSAEVLQFPLNGPSALSPQDAELLQDWILSVIDDGVVDRDFCLQGVASLFEGRYGPEVLRQAFDRMLEQGIIVIGRAGILSFGPASGDRLEAQMSKVLRQEAEERAARGEPQMTPQQRHEAIGQIALWRVESKKRLAALKVEAAAENKRLRDLEGAFKRLTEGTPDEVTFEMGRLEHTRIRQALQQDLNLEPQDQTSNLNLFDGLDRGAST